MNDQRIAATVLQTIPYPQMVSNLFKLMGSTEASFLHAAIGISGEAAELLTASSIDNIVEELGDIEFYIEAGYLVLGGRDHDVDVILAPGDPALHQVLSTITIAISSVAGNLLDIAKKGWVYERPIDGKAEMAMRQELCRIEAMMAQLRDMIGIRQADVFGANQAKLGKRYPEGVYQNSAALARADKPAGE